MKLRSILAMVALSIGSLAATAHAQQSVTLHPVQWGYYGYDDHEDHEQREYNSGYRMDHILEWKMPATDADS
jgi:hypothetical protein